ncbi:MULTISPECIES: ABC transporter permease subunit [unclassified Paenibacillus]|uniref:ABC transporter permease n=1 Tax=unclassified Paenibacillus TaxID=185978 RepID=UPI001047D8CE|nr:MULTISPECIES: ABC transporter permease subunit [unclassified Paenibacillus]NIK71977.1 putative aldouronate transport system permease protein [Paenibacillus sp. BK720]TCM89743.1 carbohydrate ABC transporter membrane protein 1 (CUT1 family) [Paenibacillus sp. BK033]
MKPLTEVAPEAGPTLKRNRFWFKAFQQRYLYMMSLPFVAWIIIFSYVPVWGWLTAFQNYKPKNSILDQKWAGFENFVELFQDERFYIVLRNTLAMSTMGLIAGFAVPVIFALLLNEIKGQFFKRSVQTISYLPHFVSWVVVAGLVYKMLSTDGGAVNQLLMWLHIIDQPIQFMAKGHLFWGIVTASDLWKETGWNSIIFLAAMAGIDPELYEASTVDGAGRFRKMWHITLPGIRTTFMVLFILSIGHLISIGFEKQFLLGNPLVADYSEVFDLYALKYGIQMSRYSYGTAIGIVNSVVSILLVFIANGIYKRVTKETVI